MSDWWTNTSLDPSSGAMKPKPLVALNHLTVPTAIVGFSFAEQHTQLEKSPTRSPCPATRPSGHCTVRVPDERDSELAATVGDRRFRLVPRGKEDRGIAVTGRP